MKTTATSPAIEAITFPTGNIIHFLQKPVASLSRAKGSKTRCNRTVTVGIGMGGYSSEQMRKLLYRRHGICENCRTDELKRVFSETPAPQAAS